MYEWDGLCEFVAVVESSSFTQASQRLGISTAQVSRQVTALEKRLSIKLLHRTTRKVSVTEAGQVYYARCRPLLDGLEIAQQAIMDIHTVPRGRLKLTAPVTYGEQTLAPLVTSFCSQYRELNVDLVLTNRAVDLVDEGFDLAIRLGQLQDSTLMARRLGSRTQSVCGSPNYLQANGQPQTLSDLQAHNCLVGSQEHWRFQEEGQSRAIKVQGLLRCNSGTVLADAARRGLGLVQLPDYYVKQDLAEGRLQEVLAGYRMMDDGIWAVYPQTRHLSVKVKMLINHLAQSL